MRQAGLKATLPRLRVLNLFATYPKRHLCAEEIYKILLGEGEDLGLATIYRVLTQFEEAGLLTRHHFEAGKAVFELNAGSHHDHLVCVRCGHVEEFYDEGIEERQSKIAQSLDFAIRAHALVVYADCLRENCSKREIDADFNHARPPRLSRA